MSDTGSTKKRKTNHSDLASQYTFPVDYNDHFETPEVAYADIMPLFTQTALTLGKSLSDLVVYDPYWCQGRMVEILAGLGVRNVINNNRDFYKDIRTKSIPGMVLFIRYYFIILDYCVFVYSIDYDILITNPPFSGEHKVKLLEYLGSVNHRSRPFAILLPIYTVTKSYWTTFILKQDRLNENFLLSLPAKSKGKASAGISPQPSFIYALAQDSYEVVELNLNYLCGIPLKCFVFMWLLSLVMFITRPILVYQ